MASSLSIGIAAAVIGVGGVGSERDRLAAIRYRQCQIAQVAMRLTALLIGFDKGGMRGNGLRKGRNGSLVLLVLHVRHAGFK